MEINSVAAVEVLELVKNLDKSVIIDKKLLKEIELAKDTTYTYYLNPNVPLYENKFMDETLELLELLIKNN